MLIFGILMGLAFGMIISCAAIAKGKDEAYMEGYAEGLKEGEKHGKEQQAD